VQEVMPKVSVIVPLFNREKFLPQLFNTLDKQSFQDFEVVLVDDGSTDNTQAWLKTHTLVNKQKVTYLHQANAGPYAARNNGLSVAKGEFIAFQDSDDEWPDYHLEHFVKGLDDNPDIDWLFGSLQRIDHMSREIKEVSNFVLENGQRHPFVSLNTESRDGMKVVVDPKAKQTAIQYCVPGSTQCALIRKTVFNQNQFDPSYRTAYDRFYAIKSVMRGHTFAFVDTTHQIYHIHDAHISLVTGVNPEKVKRSANTMLRGYSALLALASSKVEVLAIRQQLARVNAWELSIALKDLGEFRASSDAMLQAWKLVPNDWRYAKSYFVSVIRRVLAKIGIQV
jgi:glycosyltransferase involved in cell wall biosynthesis